MHDFCMTVLCSIPQDVNWTHLLCCHSQPHRFDHHPLGKATKKVCSDIAEKLLTGRLTLTMIIILIVIYFLLVILII